MTTEATRLLIREACVLHNVDVLANHEFGDSILDLLVNTDEVLRLFDAGEPFKHLLPEG